MYIYSAIPQTYFKKCVHMFLQLIYVQVYCVYVRPMNNVVLGYFKTINNTILSMFYSHVPASSKNYMR